MTGAVYPGLALTGMFARLQGEKGAGGNVLWLVVLDDFLWSVTAVAAGGTEEPQLQLPQSL